MLSKVPSTASATGPKPKKSANGDQRDVSRDRITDRDDQIAGLELVQEDAAVERGVEAFRRVEGLRRTGEAERRQGLYSKYAILLDIDPIGRRPAPGCQRAPAKSRSASFHRWCSRRYR